MSHEGNILLSKHYIIYVNQSWLECKFKIVTVFIKYLFFMLVCFDNSKQ